MLLLLLLLFSFSLLFSLHKKLQRTELSHSVPKTQNLNESNLTHLTHSLLLEILPFNSPNGPAHDDSGATGSGTDVDRIDSGGEECGLKKKKKKRAKKKKPEKDEFHLGLKEKQELVCLYPFTSSSSATQRRIKQQYDQFVKSHESNGLTLVQVGQFVNCLIEARNELQHKSEAIQRKFTITKALLFKADRSSFDRLRQQIYKLEMEQKRLEEDAFVYNWLQQQLKLSPAYKKMLQIGVCLELKAESGELVEKADTEFPEISFEELLAQEKKDSFWQKNGKPRSGSS